MSGHDQVESVARQYDTEEGELTRAALLRLEYRLGRSGKTCAVCDVEKPLASFGKDSSKPDGLSRRCKACEAGRKARARASN